MTEPELIGTRREVFWDDYLIDTERTTACLRLHQPAAREVVLAYGQPWEGDGCNFHSILKDGDLYRMYYNAWEMLSAGLQAHTLNQVKIAYAESRDGLTWEKPELGICEFSGSRKNNIILDQKTAQFDNFFVFKDPNPECPPAERYKGVGMFVGGLPSLWCFTSADGIRFTKAWCMTQKGTFDTLNTAFWDKHRGEYVAFIRDFHKPSGEDFGPGEERWRGVRDIRRMTSPDFRNWSTPERLDFGGAEDYPLYTNVAQPYYRADHVLVGFPSRYLERPEWTTSFDQLPGAERRKQRMKLNPRYGLALTDCVFMSSRDGRRWHRWDEAFIGPGPEREYNWVYGDGYPAVGMIETPSHLSGAPPELSMYAAENHWGRIPAELRRYVLRVDGFASRHAPYEQKVVVTRPFVFEGNRLSINFATSAAGWLKLDLVGEKAALGSVELFGDSLDRTVTFTNGEVSVLAGTPVTLAITMRDADIYSFKFDK